MEAAWESPRVSFTCGLECSNFPDRVWAPNRNSVNTCECIVPLNEMFHSNERSSYFTRSTSPYFRLDFLVIPDKGCISSSLPGKEHRGLSLGNSTQWCDSVGVPWLTGMGKVTLVSLGAICLCFQGPVTSANACPPLGWRNQNAHSILSLKTTLDEQREPAPLFDSSSYHFSLSVSQVFQSNICHT